MQSLGSVVVAKSYLNDWRALDKGKTPLRKPALTRTVGRAALGNLDAFSWEGRTDPDFGGQLKLNRFAIISVRPEAGLRSEVRSYRP